MATLFFYLQNIKILIYFRQLIDCLFFVVVKSKRMM